MGGRLFLKSLYSSLLLVFLTINLLIFFDLLYLVPNASPVPSDAYFGFKSFLDVFEFFKNQSFFNDFTRYVSSLSNTIRQLLYGNWVLLANNGGVYDLFSFFQAFASFFGMIAGVLSLTYYVVVFIVYIFASIGYFIFAVFYVMGGNFYSIVPNSPFPSLASLMLVPSI